MTNIQFAANDFQYTGGNTLSAPVIIPPSTGYTWAHNYRIIPNVTSKVITIIENGIYEFIVTSGLITFYGGIEITGLADSSYISLSSIGKSGSNVAGETFYYGILSSVPEFSASLNIIPMITAVAHGGIPCYEYRFYVNGILRSLTNILATQNLQLNDQIIVSSTDCCCNQLIARTFVADPLISLQHGLTWELYTGEDLSNIENMPDVGTLTFISSGISPNFTLQYDILENFEMRFRGLILISIPGNYTFYLFSDDGSTISIDGTEIVNNGGNHPTEEQCGAVNLTAGFHNIAVDFYQGGGPYALVVSWKSNDAGIDKQPIPDDVLFLGGPI
jgi:hypothetical protein